MLAAEFTLQDDFPSVDYETWRALAEADLNGASFERKLVTRLSEGINVQPVFTRNDYPGERDPSGFPGFPPFVRGSQPMGAVQSGWELCQEHSAPDLTAANHAIHDDIRGGVASLLLRLDSAARQGLDPDEPLAAELVGQDGMMVYHVDDFDDALREVDLSKTGISLEAGAAFIPAAAALAALWRRRGISPAQACGAFNADPLAVLAREGQLPVSPEQALSMMSELASWTAENYPRVRAVRVDTAAYHSAGATAAQDLAFAMATGVAYLRSMSNLGQSITTATRQILFSFSLGTHHFLSISKLRAARRLWSRVIEACGGAPDDAAMFIHARTASRVLTVRDPYVNLLRNTVAAFSAGLGGADSITSVPLDSASGLPDDFSRRIARNTVLILQEEAHLHRTIDPPGGSWYLEWLTSQLSEKAWDIFQEIERLGGMLEVISSGWVAEQIESTFASSARDIAHRKQGITGVSEFPDISEEQLTHPEPNRAELRAAATARLAGARRESETLNKLATASSPIAAAADAASDGASMGQLARGLGFHAESTKVPPLASHSFAEPFETLRDASDQWLAVQGHRPRVFLANMGSIAHHTARATFSKNFFEAGGFEVITNDGFDTADTAAAEFGQSGAAVAVICSSDKLYPDMVPELAPKLKSAGARTVVLAGHPGTNEDAWREAGVDRFIFINCDVLTTLRELLVEAGVLEQ